MDDCVLCGGRGVVDYGVLFGCRTPGIFDPCPVCERDATIAVLVASLKGLMSWEDAPLIPTEELGGAICLYCDAVYGYRIEENKWIARHQTHEAACAWVAAQSALAAVEEADGG